MTRTGPRTVAAVVVALVAGLLFVPPIEHAGAASVPPGFTDSVVFSGLTLPTAIAFAPDGRVFVAEKSGIVKVFPSVSSNSGTVFKDLRAKTYDYADRGLLGLEVDPRLGNGSGHDFIYVLYAKDALPGQTPPRWNDDCPTPPGADTDGCVITGTLSRIPVNANGTAGTEQPLIDGEWCQQFSSHSVGHLAFGTDGYLYVTGGDGASWVNADWGQFGGSLNNTPTPVNPCGDPPGAPGVANSSPTARGGALRSQSTRRPAGEPRLLNGALLRIDPDTGAGVPGNPLYNAAAPSSNASRIVAHGFRNPFRFTMRPGTSEIWVADVGWGSWEEIDRVTAPTVTPVQNFGWPCLERTTRPSGYRDLNMCSALYADTTNPARDPYFAYQHGVPVNANDTCAVNDGTVISGITFYTGNRYPAAYKNALFFGDNSKNCIFVMRAGANGLPDPTTVTTFVDNADNPFPVDLETDPVSGDVFYVDIGIGTVHRISYASSNQPPTAIAGASPTSGSAPLTVQFNSTGTTDPNGDALAYTWDTDGNGVFGDASGPSPSVVYSTAGTYNARLRVTDTGGLASTSAAVIVTVTNTAAPVNTAAPTITGTPQVGQPLTSTTGTWTGTQPITYQRQWQRCAATGDYRNAVLADTPNAYWRLGEATGTTAVDERATNNASYNAGVLLGQGGAVSGNNAATFDGADDNVLRNPLTGVGTTAITAELFVATTNTTKDAGILSYASSGNTDDFQLRDPRNITVYVRGTTIATGVAVNDGAWHHLAVTWKSAGGELKVYKDGVLAFTGVVRAGSAVTAGGAFVLGQDQDTIGGGFDPTQAFVGKLDEVAMYPTALTADRVLAHVQSVNGGGGCTDIANATSDTYTVQSVDVGARLRLHVTATNAGGSAAADSAQTATVTEGAGNTPPVPVIDLPAPSRLWSAGDVIDFAGHADDAQDGTEPASRLSWSIFVSHCSATGCHEHPLATRVGVASGQVSAPSHEAPSHIELHLTATDAAGASATVSRSIDPRASTLTFQTSPPGLLLTVGAANATTTPFTQTWVVNSQVQLSAPAQQTLGGTTYNFTGWSQGGAATQSVFVPAANTTYTATYAPVACSGTSYANAVLADAPRAYWRLGETSGATATDSGTGANHGTYVGGVALGGAGALTGIPNPAATFDGANDHMIRNPFPGMPTTAITVDLWIKTSDTTKEAGITTYASSASVDEFQLRDARNLKVYIRGTSLVTGVVLNDGAWHHLAVTWTSAGGAVQVYKDGALAFGGTLRAGYAMTTGGAWVLGQEQDTLGGGFETSQAFLGTLDEVAVYPSALTAARVQAHFAARSGTC